MLILLLLDITLANTLLLITLLIKTVFIGT